MQIFKIFQILALMLFCKTVLPDPNTQSISNVKVIICKGDITKSCRQAIVNAANPQLKAGGGVCGAIFAAAGLKNLQNACDALPIVATGQVRCPTGKACITDSFDLLKNGVKHIIHAVGPDCRIVKDEKEQDSLLTNAYLNSLALAEEKNLSSIAFPFISSAIYAFPKQRAAQVALNAIEKYASNPKSKLTTIEFVLYSQEDYEIFSKLLQTKQKTI